MLGTDDFCSQSHVGKIKRFFGGLFPRRGKSKDRKGDLEVGETSLNQEDVGAQQERQRQNQQQRQLLLLRR